MKFTFLFLLVFFLYSGSLVAQKETIVLNEFMADNKHIITDESGKHEDWIEIFNYGDKPVDIGGLYFTDDFSNPKIFRIPPGNDSTIIPPQSYLLLWADDDWEEGIHHIEFKLSKKGEQLAIFDSKAETIIDSVSFPAQESDKSWGRKADNHPEWIQWELPTPGAANKKP
jgi:hypothetical protein